MVALVEFETYAQFVIVLFGVFLALLLVPLLCLGGLLLAPFTATGTRLLVESLGSLSVDWQGMLLILVVLSLAIGKRGQNVRLASQLTGWRLDIVSESRFKQIEEEAMAALSRLSVDEEVSRSLYRMGFRSLDEVVDAVVFPAV